MKKHFFYSFLLFLFGCKNVNKSEEGIMTNAEMISHFNKYHTEFDSLQTWLQEDKLDIILSYYPADSYLDKISQERTDAYFGLMKELSISSISRGSYKNAILFYFREKKQENKEISLGYVYKIDPNKDKDEFIIFRENGEDDNTIFTKVDGEIRLEAEKLGFAKFVYKPINEHWSLICIIFERD